MLRTGLKSRKIHVSHHYKRYCMKTMFSASNLLYQMLQHQLNVKRENRCQLVFHAFGHSFGKEHGL